MKRLFSKQNRALLSELIRTDFKLRYQGSILGYAWTLLRPLFIFLILYIVFVKFLKLGTGIPHFPIYLLLGIVLWNFFNETTVQSLGSIVGRGDLIRKIKIPRWIIVLSSSISALINLFLNLIVVAIFAYFNHVEINSHVLLFPLILIEIFALSLGLSLFLSAAYVKLRDLGYIWEVLLQAGFYITPILYPLSRIPNDLIRKILLLNPMAQAIQDARYILVSNKTQVIYTTYNNKLFILIPYLIVLISVVVGVIYFKRESKEFAENI